MRKQRRRSAAQYSRIRVSMDSGCKEWLQIDVSEPTLLDSQKYI